MDDAAFRAGLSAELRRLDVAAALFVEGAGKAVARDAAKRSPRRTGRLSRSWSSETGRDARGPYADIGSEGAFYVNLVEFGSSRAGARPMLRPALENLTINVAVFR